MKPRLIPFFPKKAGLLSAFSLTAATLLLPARSAAQDYMMLAPHDLPQRLLLNPALMPSSSFLSIPGIGGLNAGIENGFGYRQVINARNYLDGRELIRRLRKNDQLLVRADAALAYFGFRFGGRSLITFSYRARVHGSVNYPVDAFRMIFDNPLARENVFHLRSKTRSLAWGEAALGYARQVTHNWTVGARVKFLNGVMGVFSDKAGFTVDKHLLDYTVRGDVDIRFGGYDLNADTHRIKPFENPGAAIDLGAEYRFELSDIRLSASVSDLGFIAWGKKSASRLVAADPDGTYRYDGFDRLQDIIDGKFTPKMMLDTIYHDLFDAIGVDSLSGRGFTAWLPARFQAGAVWPVDFQRRHTVSLNLLGTLPQTGRFHYGLTAGYTYRTLNGALNLIGTVTHKRNDPLNLGLGCLVRAGSFQFYLMADDVLSPFNLRYSRSENIAFGMNVLFGRQGRHTFRY